MKIPLFIKRFLYFLFINNVVAKTLADNNWHTLVITLSALYYSIVTGWSDSVFIKDHKPMLLNIYFIMILATAGLVLHKYFYDRFHKENNQKYAIFLESILKSVKKLVEGKSKRFYRKLDLVKAENLSKKSSDLFLLITHPRDQLTIIITETKSFLAQAFGVDDSNVEITLIAGHENLDRWWYELKSEDQRQLTKAKVLMSGSSFAKYVLQRGESTFLADIRKGIKEGYFQESTRSKHYKNEGCVYSKPIKFTIDQNTYTYVFTIAIYGQFICRPYDKEDCRNIKKIFDEIGNRVELESCLHSLRVFKENNGVKIT